MNKKHLWGLGGYVLGSFFGLGVVLGFLRGRKR